MPAMKTLGLGVVSFCFFTALLGACGASGNPVSGDTGPAPGTGVTDSGAAGDSSYGASNDSGSTTPTDSGSTTPTDSGTTTPVDSGVIFTGAGTCDITDGLTITIEEIATFVTENNPASCGSGTPCDSSHCCLDIASATGGGSLPVGPTGICLTSLNLSALGL
jgi:hypothetical protein